MDLSEDSPCIIGSACRLPGGVTRTDTLWSIFHQGDWTASSTYPPASRGFARYSNESDVPAVPSGRGGWLGEEGIEQFDAHFFHVSPSEAQTLRPNIRLALELTWEALENAGIPPSTLRGRNVSVSVGVGTEDGWDMKRWSDDGVGAFDQNWATSSDPSGVAGYVAHSFDFRGSCNTVSNACASGAFALKDGINSLCNESAELAIIGSIATHFSPAPFAWATASGVASRNGRSSAFSSDADGYSPSEGAIFFVLRRRSMAESLGEHIHGMIRALATGHNGATRTLITPNPDAQANLTRRALVAAHLKPDDISLLEAHGTGTLVGDALEAESIQSVYGSRCGKPLLLSSSKTVLGHCHGSAALVGILKVLACMKHRAVPPHHVTPHSQFSTGHIIIPVITTPLKAERIYAMVNAFGFTGSISSIVLEDLPQKHEGCLRSSQDSPPISSQFYFLPFSGHSSKTLASQICCISAWAVECKCSLRELATILGLCRDHHDYRRAIVVSSLETLSSLTAATELHVLDFPSKSASRTFQPEHRITAELLDIQNIDSSVFDDHFQRRDLSNLLETGDILEAAQVLYERGHRLAFSSVYDKREISREMLHSFPLYQFDRKRHWKEVATPHREEFWALSSETNSEPLSTITFTPTIPLPQTHGTRIDQDVFEELVRTFGRPIDLVVEPKAPKSESRAHVLLTGGNGMFGVNVLSRLLRDSSSTVYCIIRGDPWGRLRESFVKHNLDLQVLQSSKDRGSLHLLRTTDISGPKLGLSDTDYELLVETIDEIIHAAWMVNFNLPLGEFHPFIQATRNLAKLCVCSRKLVRYHFIGSYASTFNYPEGLVPESITKPLLKHSLKQGYAISKLVAEHCLLSIHRTSPSAFQLVIVRVGQICGNSKTGSWSPDEMMPMMIASLPELRALPSCFPDVSWIPSDICADALLDFVFSSRDKINNPHIFHLANPHIVPWTEIITEIGEFAGVGCLQLLSLQDYTNLLRSVQHPLPVMRLLPYFLSSLEEGTIPQKFASLEVSHSLRFSNSLASCPPIGSELLKTIVRSALSNRPLAPTPANISPVFVFGPWSSYSANSDQLKMSDPIETRIIALAEQIQRSLGDNLVRLDASLEQQLKTLASQLRIVKQLADRGILPRAVLGYCFGEYAAAVAAEIISEEVAVEIIVRRAMVLRTIKGAMINVFCKRTVIEHYLAELSDPPTIAIIAGPEHLILSGSYLQIKQAETHLHLRGVKTIAVPTSLPFHSSLMDDATILLTPFEFLPKDTSISYVSGITGTAIRGRRLGFKYWLRHMREAVEFYDSMDYVRSNFSGESIIDIGPGTLISKIISRYQWDDIKVLSPVDEALDLTIPPSKPTNSVQLPTTVRTISSTHGYTDDPTHIALDILWNMFGYEPSNALLARSLHSIGLQSMDFIRFSDALHKQTGIYVSMSAFVSDSTLSEIVRKAQLASLKK